MNPLLFCVLLAVAAPGTARAPDASSAASPDSARRADASSSGAAAGTPASAAVAARSGAAPVALVAARKSLARGKLDSVLLFLQQAGGAPADEARVLVAAAEKAHARKDEPLALQLAQVAQQRDPSQPRAARLLGEWSLAAREFGPAQRYAKLWLDAAPADPAAQKFSLRVKLLAESWHPIVIEKPHRRASARGPRDSIAVTLYGTSWCPYCRKAREYLRRRGVAFVDRDIEQDPAAQREMTIKERAAGLEHQGVPVLDVHGTLVEGFSAESFDEALAR